MRVCAGQEEGEGMTKDELTAARNLAKGLREDTAGYDAGAVLDPAADTIEQLCAEVERLQALLDVARTDTFKSLLRAAIGASLEKTMDEFQKEFGFKPTWEGGDD